jgi:Cu/Ag efflux pump CusA
MNVRFGIDFRGVREAGLFCIPASRHASAWPCHLRGINLNLSASIGFIALFGVAVLNGVVMVSHINLLRSQGMAMAQAIRLGWLRAWASSRWRWPPAPERKFSAPWQRS